MPLIRIDDHLHYLAYVFKYTGVSVEQYLIKQFGLLGFQCPIFVPTPRYLLCSHTAQRNVFLHTLEDLISPQWIAVFSAMFHGSITLLTPTFKIWQRIKSNTIELTLHRLSIQQIKKLFAYNNDFKPKTAFSSHIAAAFKLENGCSRIAAHLVTLAGKHANMRDIQHNQYRSNKNSGGQINIFNRQHKMVNEFHAKDCDPPGMQQKTKWFQRSQCVLPTMQHENSAWV